MDKQEYNKRLATWVLDMYQMKHPAVLMRLQILQQVTRLPAQEILKRLEDLKNTGECREQVP